MLRIKALGCLTVIGPDGPIVGAAAQPKRMALLALLARAGERGVTRDKVLGYFWPDAEEDRARRSLANMVWALRRDLGADDLFLAGNDLRLNTEVVSADVEEFETALAAGELGRAATLYEGQFLDGFRIAGVPEFERWVEAERMALAHEYLGAVERLARGAETKGDWGAAAGWWRKVAAQDPLNSRLALGLMQALAAAGDRVGALRHARIYEALVEQELDLPPDRAVVEYANQLREALASAPADGSDREAGAPANTTGGSSAQPVIAYDQPEIGHTPSDRPGEPTGRPAGVEMGQAVDVAVSKPTSRSPSSETFTSVPPATRLRGRLTTKVAAWGTAAVVVIGVTAFAVRARVQESAADVPVIALGQITDYRTDRSTEIVKPLTDMLATALARSPALRVVSTARMYELGSRLPPAGSSDAATDSHVRAARAAGATELLEGSLYALDDGTLRLDLRCIDIATGNVRTAHSVIARSPFALADSGTARLIAEVGGTVPNGSIADVTTRSLAAYRFYDEGLRAFYQDDVSAAARLFRAAMAEDTTFASAAYYLALSLRRDEERNYVPMLARAVRLAEHASDRERLIIRAHWELVTSSPNLRASVESLLTRYPQEVEAYLLTGIVCVADGQFLDAVPYLQHAIAMDSLSLNGGRAMCSACEAFRWLLSAYLLADSLTLAERDVRRWLKLQPRSGMVYPSLVNVLLAQGRTDEAIAAWRERSAMAPGRETDADIIPRIKIYAGAFDEADALMRGVAANGNPLRRLDAYWLLALSERYQGRLSAALVDAREQQRIAREVRPDAVPPAGGIAEAQVLLELGRGRESAVMFDAVARWNPGSMPSPEESPGAIGRHRAWHMTHAADALAAIGDTAGLLARADTVEVYGSRSASRVHRQLHHHVRGLLFAARRRDGEAIAEFRQAMDSPTSAYTRTNYELARALLRVARPSEAVAVLQPALRGTIEAGNYYVTATEIHELLAQAWDTLGTTPGAGAALSVRVSPAAARDSAAAHYRWVARAWARGDAPFAARAAQAGSRAATLGH